MLKDKTEVACILDRSGSMLSIISDAIGGYNAFLEEQKKNPQEANLTVVMFDDRYEISYMGPLHNASAMTRETYVPRGNTALRDAIGRTINTLGSKLAATPEHVRPGRVIVVIVTDGEENASKEFSAEQIAHMIEHQRTKYSWEFIFLAANLDAVAVGMQYGINPHFAINFVANARSSRGSYGLVSKCVSSYRESGAVDNCLRGVDVNAEGEVVARVDAADSSAKD